MLVTLESIKNYLGINNTPVLLSFDIDATANTLTRATGSWISAGVVVGTQLTLAGFNTPANNIVVTVIDVTALTLTISEVVSMVTEVGNPLCSYRIEVTTHDAFLTAQGTLVSDTIEEYCGRKFALATWIQTFYPEDYNFPLNKLALYQYPVTEVSRIEIKEDATVIEDLAADIRLQKEGGYLINKSGFFNSFCNTYLEVEYEAGYAAIPSTILSVVYSLIQERYNKEQSGVSLNFGSDVQRVSVPGVISVDFDYTLQSNKRDSAFGSILGNYANVLDSYRSERVIVGSGELTYVEASP